MNTNTITRVTTTPDEYGACTINIAGRRYTLHTTVLGDIRTAAGHTLDGIENELHWCYGITAHIDRDRVAAGMQRSRDRFAAERAAHMAVTA